MGDETTNNVQCVEACDKDPGEELPQNADTLVSTEVTPDDSWFEHDILKRLKGALKNGFMSDLTVRLQDGNVCCHSNILGFSSPKLAAMIKKNRLEINLSGVKCSTFRTLLRIIYSEEADKIKTDLKNILDVTKVAYELKAFSAASYGIKILKELLEATNVCSIFDFAFLLDHKELKEACSRVTREQTDAVLQSEGFLKCNVAILEHILKQDDVYNVTELDLFQAAVRWANTHTNPREALGSCLGRIRFRTLSNDDIAAYVTPTKLLTETEERAFLFYLLAKGKGELPAGFSNEMSKRNTTLSVEHFSGSTEQIYLGGHHYKDVTKKELNATPPLHISVNEDAFLIGVRLISYREGKKSCEKYMEDVEITLKDDKGTLISTVPFRGEVEHLSWNDVKFPHAVEICADVRYKLHFSNNVSGVKHQTWKRNKQVNNSDKTSLQINLLEERYSPIGCIIIARKRVNIKP